MDEKTVCFIVCVNEPRYYEECKKYIRQLLVPEGYQVEVIAVYDAKSMTAGYNKAMRASNAKYKVYLHQDVFIICPDFIKIMLQKFQTTKAGMLGVIGCIKLPNSGIMWETERVGNVDTILFGKRNHLCNQEKGIDKTVEAIDGLLMITQYDVPWREDLFDNWDFYDISQCKEFQRAGYKVIVPYMERPWCIHDDGILSLENYNADRQIFLKEYKTDMGKILKEKTDNYFG